MNIYNFDIRLLRVFDALAAEGNVSRAAARLHLTQSATSQALGKLRRALGDPLFVRVGQAMQPTAKASAMVPQVRLALEILSDALDAATIFSPAESRRSFRIAATDYSLLMLLPELTRRLSRFAPGIQLITSAVSPDRGLDYIRDGRIDLLIAYFVVTKVPKNFRTRLLLRDSYSVLVRKDHPKLKSRLTLTQFASANHVVVAPRDSWQPGPLDTALAHLGVKRITRLMVPYYLIVPYIVAETDLIATVPTTLAKQFPPRLPIRTFPLPLDVPGFRLDMVWDERNHRDAAHKWLRDEIGKLTDA